MLEVAALPQPVSQSDVDRILGKKFAHPGTMLSLCSLAPWFHVQTVPGTGTEAGQVIKYKVTVDHDLKALCDNHVPGPTGESPDAFVKRVLAELIRQRKGVEDRFRGNWVPDNTSKMGLVRILDWIQTELYQFTSGHSINGRSAASALPLAQENHHGEEDQVRTTAAHKRTGNPVL